jgi:hypothetical protein
MPWLVAANLALNCLVLYFTWKTHNLNLKTQAIYQQMGR